MVICQGGWNPAALIALALGTLPSVPGFLTAVGLLTTTAPIFALIYDFSWFIGFFGSFLAYWGLMSHEGFASPKVDASAPLPLST
jgi:NCS1 family nucleobase:cation symporter-1